MSIERIRAPEEPIEVEYFDDFGAMDVALRGLERVLADRSPKPDTVSGEDGYEYDNDDEGDERLEELEREKQFEVLTIPQEILEEYKLPKDLPAGVAVMGGTARSLARRVVTGDKEPVRDLDLVYIPEFANPENPVSQEELDKIAEKYMPDDFAFGHGIQSEHLEDYFGNRDFTINQCLVVGDKLMMTRAAYDDFQENIIRLSHYEQPYEYSPVGDRMFMKALLLKATLQDCTSSYPTTEGIMNGRYDDYDNLYMVGDFQMALALNKAMSRGVRTARYLSEILVDYDVVDEKYIDQPMKLARDIMERGEIYFEFRPMSGRSDDGWDEDFEVATTSPISADVRRKLKEYKSIRNERWSEPMSGEYTEADYDRINGVRKIS